MDAGTMPSEDHVEAHETAFADVPRIETMVQLYFDVVWRSLRRLGVPDGAVDDAAQQVFLVAARKLDTIEPAGEKPYLLGIAVRVASDARRTQARRREVSDDSLGDHTSSIASELASSSTAFWP
jgi:DNA-directed RNA polymerase specialized sigma24 family protein